MSASYSGEDQHVQVRGHDWASPTLQNVALTTARTSKDSQETPTQINTNRNYEAFCGPLASSWAGSVSNRASSHAIATLQDGSADRSLHHDDTGAVDFGKLSDLPRLSSQLSEDAGFDNTRGDWRDQDVTLPPASARGLKPFKPDGLPPKTPALAKNPFGPAQSVAAPYAGTQLFGQTQASSAIKKVSPTSSRPSPNLLHDPISPGAPDTSPLKGRANVSSPTEFRTSSPQRMDEVPSTSAQARAPGRLASICEETPMNLKVMKEDCVPESPTTSHAHPRSSLRDPLARYEPMRKSQERKSRASVSASPVLFDGDGESDDASHRMQRRKRLEQKKAQAAEEMGKICYTRFNHSRPTQQPPSKKRRLAGGNGLNVSTDPDSPGNQTPKSFGSAPVVRDSQRRSQASRVLASVRSKHAGAGAQQDPTLASEHSAGLRDSPLNKVKPGDDEMIPATSPPISTPALDVQSTCPAPDPDLPSVERRPELHSNDDDTAAESSSLPLTTRRGRLPLGQRSQRRNVLISSSASDHNVEDDLPREALSQEVEPTERGGVRFHSPDRDECPRNPLTPQAEDRRPATDASSSLTTLSNTPSQSSETKPSTLPPKASRTGPDKLAEALRPEGQQEIRYFRFTSSDFPGPSRRAVRLPKKDDHPRPNSRDELSRYRADKSRAGSKPTRVSRHKLVANRTGGHLFEGMIFAISFRSSGPNTSRQSDRDRIERQISLGGGSILQDGFQDLFEPSPELITARPVFDQEDSLRLTKRGSACSFAALIADGHSRKAKYMQALALGLPCLAHQWVTACVERDAIVDWESYLLCSGSSQVLDGAIRSRCLAPFTATETSLATIVDRRPRLFTGQSILVVAKPDTKRSHSAAKQPYIFLMQALGPSVTRVFTKQQARDVMCERKRAQRPFDWVYVDRGTGTVDAMFAPDAGGKKRKVSGTRAALSSSTRILDDELVIQSLILGRMVRKGEI